MQQKGYIMKNDPSATPATSAQASEFKRIVNAVIMHREFHLDEAGAYWLGIQAGEDVFTGIGNASIVFSENCPDASVELWKARHQLAIGTGGDIADEHTSGNNSRMKNECSMSLMLKAIGGPLMKDPAVKRMVAEVLRFDQDTGCPKGHLAEFIKITHRCMTGADPVLLKWCQSALSAVYKRLCLNHAAVAGEKSLAEHAEAAFKAKSSVYTDAKAIAYVLKALKEVETEAGKQRSEGKPELVFSLDFVYKSFLRVNAADAKDNIMFIVDKMYQDQVAFQALRPIVTQKARKIWVRALLHGKEQNICAMIVHSTDPRAAKVLKTLGAKIMVVINNGRPCILKNNEVRGLSFKHCRAMLRWLELTPNQKHAVQKGEKASFEELVETEGVHPWALQWYAPDYMVANATTTHTGLPKTQIIDATVRFVIEHAFHPGMIAHWKRVSGVTVAPQKLAAGKGNGNGKPQAAAKPAAAPVANKSGNGQGGYTHTIADEMKVTIGDVAAVTPAPEEKKEEHDVVAA
jgi:hypothetical protein